MKYYIHAETVDFTRDDLHTLPVVFDCEREAALFVQRLERKACENEPYENWRSLEIIRYKNRWTFAYPTRNYIITTEAL